MKLQKIQNKTNIQTILSCIVLLLCTYFFKFPCMIYETTGLYCPGCGITRSIIALIHLDLYQSFRYNPLIFILYPVLIPYIIYEGYICLFNKDDKITKKIPNKAIYLLLIIIIVYGILRNIDYFDYLKPTKI